MAQAMKANIAGGKQMDIAQMTRAQQEKIAAAVAAVAHGRYSLATLEQRVKDGLAQIKANLLRGIRPDYETTENLMMLDIAARLIRQQPAAPQASNPAPQTSEATEDGWQRLLNNIQPIAHAPECTCAKCR